MDISRSISQVFLVEKRNRNHRHVMFLIVQHDSTRGFSTTIERATHTTENRTDVVAILRILGVASAFVRRRFDLFF